MLVSCRVLFFLCLSLAASVNGKPIGEAARIVQTLKMTRIPEEGAWFAATYRSGDSVPGTAFGTRYQGAARVAGSAIYALVTREDFSALHRLATDEIWHYYRGDPLELVLLHPDGRGEVVVLGPDILKGQHPQFVVPRGTWQGARPARDAADAYTLFGCTLAPGFEYGDFTIAYRDELQKSHPKFAHHIRELTRPPFAAKPAAAITPQAEDNEAHVFSADRAASVEIAQGIELRELIGRTGYAKSAAQSVALFTLAPGQAMPRSFNRAAEESIVIAAGRGEVTLGNERHSIREGDLVLIKPTREHSIKAASDSILRFYAISAPAFSPDDYVVAP